MGEVSLRRWRRDRNGISYWPMNPMDENSRIEPLLEAWNQGDHPDALNALMPLAFDEFRAIAEKSFRNEEPNLLLGPLALVNECYIKLYEKKRVRWEGISSFYAYVAKLMRTILVDDARRRSSRKRRGLGSPLVSLGIEEVSEILEDSYYFVDFHEIFSLREALEKLQLIEPLQAMIVQSRFFGGLNYSDIAGLTGVGEGEIKYSWKKARNWLLRELRSSTKQVQEYRSSASNLPCKEEEEARGPLDLLVKDLQAVFSKVGRLTLGDALRLARKNGLSESAALIALERLARVNIDSFERYLIDYSSHQVCILSPGEVRRRLTGRTGAEQDEWMSLVEVVWASSPEKAISAKVES